MSPASSGPPAEASRADDSNERREDPDDLDLYDFDLPRKLIAQEPTRRRDGSRLLVVHRATGELVSTAFRELPRWLRADDLLVLNDARVFPARIRLRRSGGGDAEVLLLEPRRPDDEQACWEAIVRPARWARRLLERGTPLEFDAAGESAAAGAEIRSELGSGRFLLSVRRNGEILDAPGVIALCEEIGETPLPPYIHRKPDDDRRAIDRTRYQTIYARAPVAVAAPTAGLHFSDEVFAHLDAAGIERVTITHQVGMGTFQPLRSGDLSAPELHAESSVITVAAGERILAARRDGRRIVAVGTTTVRALESFALASGALPHEAATTLFIKPGHCFRLVDAMLTNFHLPRSSLLVLVSAFAGHDRILAAYHHAVAADFRFYSYGDAMLIL